MNLDWEDKKIPLKVKNHMKKLVMVEKLTLVILLDYYMIQALDYSMI